MGYQEFIVEHYQFIYDVAVTHLPPWRYSIGNFVACFLNILVNYLVQTGNTGQTNADLSAANETPITPAGWTFSIWGLIFSLQILGSVFGVVPFIKNENLLKFRRSSLLTIGHGWQIGWTFQFIWQVLFKIQTPFGNALCFLALLGAYLSFLIPTLKFHQTGALATVTESPLNYAGYVLPTSINAAWLNIAMPLGLAISLKSFGVGWTPLSYISSVLLGAIVATGTYMTAVNKDFAYSIALIWGIQGIRSKHADAKLISWTALAGQIVLLVAIVYQIFNQVQLYRNPSFYDRIENAIEGEL